MILFHLSTLLMLSCATLTTSLLPTKDKPPFFILVGDSTTAPIQPWKETKPPGGGGWGDGFLETLKKDMGATGVNLGRNGQTTVSYRENGFWKEVVATVGKKTGAFDVFVSLQLGHNDQKTAKGISLTQFEENLERMVEELKKLGANVVSFEIIFFLLLWFL